ATLKNKAAQEQVRHLLEAVFLRLKFSKDRLAIMRIMTNTKMITRGIYERVHTNQEDREHDLHRVEGAITELATERMRQLNV
ncbi:MAG: hypothetical protein QF442_00315, partial [Candidatus Peribacteraceae bacterium]|nr:hypothetical protein [Candidatus Peribacteraceae bacterium]